MASGTPIIRQINWFALIPQLGLFIGFIFIFKFQGLSNPSLVALAAYLILVYGLRFFLAKYHRYGMMFLKRNEFEAAIPYFENSYEYFSEKPWLDRFRAIFLLSSSRISYKEMALVNIAYCYSQLGNGKKAKVYYERALQEFPESEIAKASLNMINSAENTSSE